MGAATAALPLSDSVVVVAAAALLLPLLVALSALEAPAEGATAPTVLVPFNVLEGAAVASFPLLKHVSKHPSTRQTEIIRLWF